MVQRQICDMVATILGIDLNEVLDFMADSAYNLDLLNDFTAEKGFNCLLFFYQNGPPFEIGTNR